VAAFPLPSQEAQAHSQSLVDHIARRITECSGWISFADYMSMALYAPGLGYYTAGARKFGASGDFITAPELTPLFGQAIAAQARQVLEATGGDILELGAGSGRLAVDMLRELERLDCLPGRYFILDLSPDLRQRQRLLLQAEAPHLLERVVWLDALPERFAGFIIGNEVLDAMPVHLVHWLDGAVYERGVAWSSAAGFVWEDRRLAAGHLHDVAQSLPIAGLDYLSEINLAAPALIRSLSDCMVRGLVLFLDYGFPQAEYYHPDRKAGTLMCHHRHHAFDDPFFLPGLTDITAHVDFTAIADAALAVDLEVLGYATQARFLLNCGVLAGLERKVPGTVDYLKQTVAVQKLIQPSEMGELFKVIALGRGVDLSPAGFALGDRRHTL
jgi:SAM-dependent MidA family methyltransferase